MGKRSTQSSRLAKKFYNTVSHSTLQYKNIPNIQKYPQLSEKPIKLLFPFPTTYLSEARISSCSLIKTAYHNRLIAEADMSSFY